MFLSCRVGYEGLFGLDVIQPRHTEVVLTASEFDAMAVHQATRLPAVALPKGDSTLPLKVSTTEYPPEGYPQSEILSGERTLPDQVGYILTRPNTTENWSCREKMTNVPASTIE